MNSLLISKNSGHNAQCTGSQSAASPYGDPGNAVQKQEGAAVKNVFNKGPPSRTISVDEVGATGRKLRRKVTADLRGTVKEEMAIGEALETVENLCTSEMILMA